MKKIFLFIILAIFCKFFAFSQSHPDTKKDYVWMFGQGEMPFPGMVLAGIDFNSNPPDTFSYDKQANIFHTNASICDTNGNLLFFTNGMYVFDKYGDRMPHGDSLNFGQYYEECEAQGYFMNAYNVLRVIMIIPFVNDPAKYYIIHQRFIPAELNFNGYSDQLCYTVVDMALNHNLGDVTLKNQEIISRDTLSNSVVACRHANGKDWWILVRKMFSNKFYSILLNPTGFHLNSFSVPSNNTARMYSGDAFFSETGEKYVQFFDTINDLQLPRILEIFDFNRWLGTLSGYRSTTLTDSILGYTSCLSPNGRFFYCSNNWRLFQFDLEAADVAGSRYTVATWDGTCYQGPANAFQNNALAADGKIYSHTSAKFHVINQPDMPGVQCNFTPYYLTLPTCCSIFNIPYFPNFRLGAITGLNDPSLSSVKMKAIPNPAAGWVRIETNIFNNHKPLSFEIVDVMGKVVHKEYFAPFQSIIHYNVSSLPNGIYQVCLSNNQRILGSTRLVVSH